MNIEYSGNDEEYKVRNMVEKGLSQVVSRSLVFHFARHFIDYCRENKIEWIYEYNVDCEYNREEDKGINFKEVYYEDVTHRVFPDFIVHKRAKTDNLLVIEFKKYDNHENEKDIKKLKAFTEAYQKYKYKMGLFIQFEKIRERTVIRRFINGHEIKAKN